MLRSDSTIQRYVNKVVVSERSDQQKEDQIVNMLVMRSIQNSTSIEAYDRFPNRVVEM